MSLFVKLLPAPASVPKLSTAAAWIGSVLLVQAILLAPDFGNLFGPDGYFRLELTNALQEPAIRHSQLAHWLEHNFSVELGLRFRLSLIAWPDWHGAESAQGPVRCDGVGYQKPLDRE